MKNVKDHQIMLVLWIVLVVVYLSILVSAIIMGDRLQISLVMVLLPFFVLFVILSFIDILEEKREHERMFKNE